MAHLSALIIETHGLRKQFGPTVAVADLSLRVGAGEIFGFLGPNGAGKTTSIKMLLALVEPTSGTGQRARRAARRSRGPRAHRLSSRALPLSRHAHRDASCCGFTAASMGCAASRWTPASIGC